MMESNIEFIVFGAIAAIGLWSACVLVYKSLINKKNFVTGILPDFNFDFYRYIKEKLLINIGYDDKHSILLNIKNNRIQKFIDNNITLFPSFNSGTILKEDLFVIEEHKKYMATITVIKGTTLFIIPINIRINRKIVSIDVNDVLIATEKSLKSAINYDLTEDDSPKLLKIDAMDKVDSCISVNITSDLKQLEIYNGNTPLIKHNL